MGQEFVKNRIGRNDRETEDRYFDLRRLSRYSSFSVRTLRDYIARSDDPIPSFRIGRKIIVKQSEFDSWMEKYRGKSGNLNVLVADILGELGKG
jgi:hypothetical protein